MSGENRRAIGALAEGAAADYLEQKGYVIRERNFRCRLGEIDLIAEKDGLLVFVEVKYRRTAICGLPYDAVDERKQRRICHAALAYYGRHGYAAGRMCRFDVIAVYADGRIEHLENAFDYCPG